jgi:peptide/nickel transport system permease protein
MLGSISFPDFFIAYLLVLFLAVNNSYFPAIANLSDGLTFLDLLERCFLPAVTLSLVIMSHIMRMTRASIINILDLPYIEMAKLKGMSSVRVVVVHALPNALAPIINVIALNLGYLITGVVVIEVVFVYSGLGQLMVDSVSKQDVTVVQACCLIFASVYILLNLLADVLSYVTNPRLLHSR